MAELPADSPYRLTIGESLLRPLRQLWRRVRDPARAAARRVVAGQGVG